jgi:uncharacterized DUF497 family protein
MMYYYNFDPQKNRKLVELRGISFEEVISVLEHKGPIDIVRHHNDEKYSHQRLYVVDLHGYVYLVPFVERENEIFLKTIFPSRKATKKYLGKGDKNYD